MKRIDHSGQRFGRWTVIRQADRTTKTKNTGALWECRCDCGVTKTVAASNLRSGKSHSCGCLADELSSARMLRTGVLANGATPRLYRVWLSMRERCNNPKCKGFANYGGRGIRVCQRWNSYEAFVADMGDPAPGWSLDRQNNDGNYEPGNCRWATRKMQNRNTQATIWIFFRDHKISLPDACEKLGIDIQKVYQRRYRTGRPHAEIFAEMAARCT